MIEKNVLITGGAGFIGRYVRSRLSELRIPYQVWDIEYGGDVLDEKAIHESWDPETIFAVIHLAGLLGTHELWNNTDRAIDVNVKGGLNVARWCAEQQIKLVSIEQPHIWYNVYEATKLAVRRMMTGLYYDEGLEVDFVTAHNAYGPGQAHGEGHPRKIIPYFATQAWAGEPLEIWGNGEQEVNLVYAGDVADMLVKRALAPSSNPFKEWQAGTNNLVKVKYVAEAVVNYVAMAKGLRSDIVHNYGGRPGEQDFDRYPQPDDSYPYRPSHELLGATIEWYRPDDRL
jgi:UDP-glucose 4-epimerase